MSWVAVRVCRIRLYLSGWCAVIRGMSCRRVFRGSVIGVGGFVISGGVR